MPEKGRRSQSLRLVRWAASLAVLGLFVWLLLRLDLSRVLTALRQTDWRLVLLAVFLNLSLNLCARAERWWLLLGPLPHRGPAVRVGELWRVLVASFALSNLVPARAGEALRTVSLARQGYPVGALIASQFFEKILEAASLLLLALPAALTPHAASLARPVALVAAAAGGGAIIVLVMAARARARAKTPLTVPDPQVQHGFHPVARLGARVRALVVQLTDALRLMQSPRLWAKGLALSLAADLADATMIGLCLAAVDIHLDVAVWFFVLLALNVAISLPSTPAQVGLLEAGAVAALLAFDVPPTDALAFALLYHAAHVVPTIAVGVPLLVHESRRPRLARPPLTPQPDADPAQ
jgi:uncharacterized protein (TIRG00374 family)